MQPARPPGSQDERHGRLAKWASEFIGTFFLLFTVGCSAHGAGIFAAIAIGSILMVMVFALGSVSGAHFNPAVTLAVLISGRSKIAPLDAVLYVVFQLLGGVVGAVAYWVVVGKAFLVRPVGMYSTTDAAVAEIFYSGALCYVVLNVATTEGPRGCSPNHFFGLAIGLTVTAAAVSIGPISGCSLNPAVSVASIFVAYLAHGPQALNFWWLYCLAPFAGAVIAFLFFYLARWRWEYSGRAPDALPVDRPSLPVDRRKGAGSGTPTRTAPSSSSARLLARRGQPGLLSGTQILRRQEMLALSSLGPKVESHNLFAGISWQVDVASGLSITGVDVDASCVKFGGDFRDQGAVYFADKRDLANGIQYSNDPHDCGEGGDNEIIKFNLRNVQPDVHFLFICLTIFSSGAHSLRDVTKFSVRLVDADDDKRELLKFEGADSTTRKGNALVVAAVFRSAGGWCFKAIDESYQIEGTGTYKALLPQLQGWCRRTVEAAGKQPLV